MIYNPDINFVRELKGGGLPYVIVSMYFIYFEGLIW